LILRLLPTALELDNDSVKPVVWSPYFAYGTFVLLVVSLAIGFDSAIVTPVVPFNDSNSEAQPYSFFITAAT